MLDEILASGEADLSFAIEGDNFKELIQQKMMTVESTENASDLSTDSGSVANDDLLTPGGLAASGLETSSIPEGKRLPIF